MLPPSRGARVRSTRRRPRGGVLAGGPEREDELQQRAPRVAQGAAGRRAGRGGGHGGERRAVRRGAAPGAGDEEPSFRRRGAAVRVVVRGCAPRRCEGVEGRGAVVEPRAERRRARGAVELEAPRGADESAEAELQGPRRCFQIPPHQLEAAPAAARAGRAAPRARPPAAVRRPARRRDGAGRRRVPPSGRCRRRLGPLLLLSGASAVHLRLLLREVRLGKGPLALQGRAACDDCAQVHRGGLRVRRGDRSGRRARAQQQRVHLLLLRRGSHMGLLRSARGGDPQDDGARDGGAARD